MPSWIDLVVEDLRLPHECARRGIERKDVIVVGGVYDGVAVDGDVPVYADEAAEVVIDVIRNLALVFPFEVTSDGVDCMNDVVRVWHVQRAVVHDRRALLGTLC